MIRSVGRAGPVKVAALVLWQLRFDLVAILAIAALMVPIPDAIQADSATAVLSVLGIGATISSAFATATPTTGGGRRARCGAASSSTAGLCTTA
jgi:putative membrane protein